MKEIKHGYSIVRIHGNVNKECLREAATKFLKKVEIQKNEKTNFKERTNA